MTEKTFAEKLGEAIGQTPKTEKALAEKAAKAPIAGGVLQLFPRAMYHLALTSKAGADKYGTTVSTDRKSTRLNSSHIQKSRMPSSA